MATSRLNILVPEMNPLGVPTAIDPALLTPEQREWLKFLQGQAYDAGLIDVPPDLQLRSGNSFGASSPTAPLPATTQPPGVTGGTLPGVTGTPIANGTFTAAPAATTAGTAAMDPISLAILGGSTIANIIGADNAADASREAAQIQAQAAREALEQNERFWNQTQQNQAPWLHAGTGAIGSLANLMGVPMLAPAQLAPIASTAPPPRTAVPRQPPAAATPPTTAQPRGLGARLREYAATRSAGSGRTPAAAANPRASSFVRLQSPDGAETMDVPPDQAAHYERLGARRI